MGKQTPKGTIVSATLMARAYHVVWDASEQIHTLVAPNEVPQIGVAPKEHPLRRDLGGGG